MLLYAFHGAIVTVTVTTTMTAVDYVKMKKMLGMNIA